MSKILQNIEVPIDKELEDHLQWLMPDHGPYRILRQSVDARRRHSPHFVYTLEIADKNETLSQFHFPVEKISGAKVESSDFHKPIIVGSGPAGLFAALRLVEHGIPCRLFERGSESTERIKGINQFWRYGKLDPRNNVCYGEGGAGLYSDGKLITRIKSPHIPYVLNRLVQFGAPKEIEWLSNPHVGSDKIRRVIPKMRDYLRANGCEIFFNTQITELLVGDDGRSLQGVLTEKGEKFYADQVILATGHSAEDMLYHLRDIKVHLEGKSFAFGVRVEHLQKQINQIQYREFSEHPKLGSANYKLTHHNSATGVGVYSFCMCPGGYVLSSGTEAQALVCNGMSNYHRNGPYANAAVVVSVDHKTWFGEKNIFAGLDLRRQMEQAAWQSVQNAGGSKELPAQSMMAFLEKRPTLHAEQLQIEKSASDRRTGISSSPSGVKWIQVDQILPASAYQSLVEGLQAFEKKMKGFIHPEAKVYGVESRTSCPVRVVRDAKTLQSISHAGLYPAGEGAGYAGGITSAACDGVNIADQIFAGLVK
ncbi:MAG: NAD(P)/FAD-dependent oxidoreductase [Pseudobdellovibrionaceae bacterium]